MTERFDAEPRKTRRRARLLASTALLSLTVSAVSVSAQTACQDNLLPQPEECRRANGDIAVEMPVGENAETVETAPGTGFSSLGFSISIEGQTVAGALAPATPQRTTDRQAAAADIDVRYDGLIPATILNVSTSDLRAGYQAGETVTFRASANYPTWIERAEIVVYDMAAPGRGIVARIPTAPNGETQWTMPEDGSGELAYALRVYDSAGRYDETVALDLVRTSAAFETHATTGPVTAAGEAEDRTRRKTIPVRGGQVTISGGNIGTAVEVMGEMVPVDPDGRFVISRILPPGDHVVTVKANGGSVVRDVNIPVSDWFYVGIADLTLGKYLNDDLAEADPDYEDTYIDGRLAGYAKGTTAAGYTITGSIDTGEGPIEDAFRRLGNKDPRRVIERMDPSNLYPTYGDDSTSYDDAPTSGRFYLKVAKEASSLTWGDFKSDIDGTTFLRQSRGLYGAELRYVTPSLLADGDPRATVTLYAAQPDTLPQRDILRGTGGSVYFLSRQDIDIGSETITVETIDPVTGRVVGRAMLTEGVDYQINYLQGVLILTRPLGSSVDGGGLVTDGNGSLDANLLAQYEYTPTGGSLDGSSFGGRATVAATDRLTLGVTALSETTGAADQRMTGVDLHYALGETSFIEAEIAQTDGPGIGRAFSTDGGLTITSDGIAGGGKAQAYRFDSRFDLAELGLSRPGFVQVYGERKDAGFSTLTEDIAEDQTLLGLKSEVEVSARLTFGLDAETFDKDGGDRKDSAEMRLAYDLTPVWSVEAGLAYLDQRILAEPEDTGRRTDLGLRLNYQPSDDLLLYVFGQSTLSTSGGIGRNDRLGAGFDTRLSEKLSLYGEVSDGDKGPGAKAKLSYRPTADNEVYLGYTLDPTRTGAAYELVGRDRGKIVLGGRYKYSDSVSTWTESGWDLYGERKSLARTYGVTYTPDARWTFSGGVESGIVRDSVNGDFDRDAISLGAAYKGEGAVSARARLEYRTEDGAGLPQDRETWAMSGGFEYKLNDNWRILANLDALKSTSDQDSFRDGEYVEASLGYAYRPVDNERLNLLMRYIYLRDLPGVDQVSANGTTEGPLQVSHVFSIDGTYDLSTRLTLGAKYGFRTSRIAERGTDVFVDNTAHLGIVRLDWNVVHKWDLLAEGRLLVTEGIATTDTGALLSLYRHFGNNAKVGLGYEWGKVSDDLTEIDYTGSGVFLNMIAKF
jgi:hypothetical protein